MESAELERTTVDILADAGTRQLEFRATGQVVRFDGFLALYQEGRDDEEDEDPAACRRWRRARALTKERIEATQHFTEPPPRFTEATLVKRMEELGIGRPSTYASTLAVLRDRDYVRLEKKRLFPEDKGRLVTAFLEAFFAKYVGYDFTADLEEKLDEVSNSEIDWKAVLRDFWGDFSARSTAPRICAPRQVLDSLNELLGPHIFPARGDGADPRLCPLCGKGQLSLKLGKFGAFIGCSNYPECRFTRVLSPNAAESAEGERPGVQVLGDDPASGRGGHVAHRPLRRLRAARRRREAETLLAAARARARRCDARKGGRAAVAAARGRAPSGERRADPRRRRPLRRLCAARQDVRQSRPRRRRAGDRRQPRHRPHRRQGERCGRPRFGGGGSGRALGEHPRGRRRSASSRAASALTSITARSTRRCRGEPTRPA